MLPDNMNRNHYCIIMAGGAGTRLWPISRTDFPKQFIEVGNTGKSFLRTTYDRFADFFIPENIIVVTNSRYKNLVKQQIPELDDSNILAEPYSRNTAPCVAYATYTLLKRNPDAAMVVTPADHLIFDEDKFRETIINALDYAATDDDRAFIYTLMARACYRLGDKARATDYAETALGYSADFTHMVEYDGDHGFTSSIQGYLYGTNFQPLPRLDFLDPKYFQKNSSTEARPVCIAKAEEPYLILAEAALADGDLAAAKGYLHTLLALVNSRPVETGINDQLEERYNGGFKKFPNSSAYRVAASADDPLRSGLVLDRQAPNLIAIPYISGTSATAEMIDQPATVDALLEIVYLMRQEIFIAEGRRVADLGIRLPVCETEAANTPSAANYTTAQIPSFIPGDKGMDEFTMDEENKTVVIKYNMNRIIVENKSSEYVAPFFH